MKEKTKSFWKKQHQKVKAWRKANPKKYAYQTLRNNAKRRGKEFTITYEYFCVFCYRYKYIGRKGRTADGYGIDRINETKGYVPGNIAIKKNGNNTRKYKAYEWSTKYGTTVTVEENKEDSPF